jgi:hypothetical protein
MKVVVVVAHGLGARWLGTYGNEWIQTPSADALAADAVVFDQCYATSPTIEGFAQGLPEWFDRIHEAGVDVIRIEDETGDDLVDDLPIGLQELAKSPRGLLWIETSQLLPPWKIDEESFTEYAHALQPFEERDELEPFTYLTDPLAEFDAVADPISVRAAYAAAVGRFDQAIGDLLDGFLELQLDEEAWLLVTSSSGWPAGEHGSVGFTQSALYRERVQVPMLIRLPGGEEGLRRVPDLVTCRDLIPTLEAILEIPAEKPGQSLLDLCRGKGKGADEVLCLLPTPEGLSATLRNPEWAYLQLPDGTEKLFHKPDDIWEVNNVSHPQPGVIEEMNQRLRELTNEKEASHGDRQAGG